MNALIKLRYVLLLIILLPASYLAFKNIPVRTELSSEPLYVGKKLGEVAGENIVLMDTSNNLFDISNFTAAVHILVFYNGDCKQCQGKQNALRKIAQKYMKRQVQVIYIRPGMESFRDFLDYPLKKAVRLYDEDSRLTEALQIRLFPTEVILDENGMIKNVTSGYDGRSEKEYLESTAIKIDSLLAHGKLSQ